VSVTELATSASNLAILPVLALTGKRTLFKAVAMITAETLALVTVATPHATAAVVMEQPATSVVEKVILPVSVQVRTLVMVMVDVMVAPTNSMASVAMEEEMEVESVTDVVTMGTWLVNVSPPTTCATTARKKATWLATVPKTVR